jgi:hypothetical protein
MKKTTFVLALLCAFITRVSAQDCKFDVKDKDKFTGKTKVSYWYQLGTSILYIHKLDDKYTIEISTSSPGAMQKGVEKGETGQFRLANGEFVTFTASENAEPVVKVNGAKTDYTSTIRAFYDITPEELAKMAASAPLALKIMLGSKEVVKEFSDKKSEKIRVAAKCLIDYKE